MHISRGVHCRAPDSAICGVWGLFYICLLFLVSYRVFGAREGLEMVRGWIPLHLDQVSAQINHSGPIWGPFLIVDFFKNPSGPQIAPPWSHMRLGSWTF